MHPKHCAGHGLAKPEDEAADRNGRDRSQRRMEDESEKDHQPAGCERAKASWERHVSCGADRNHYQHDLRSSNTTALKPVINPLHQ
jgi:hypothetical protein